MKPELTQDLLHELFEYRDGVLYWKSKPNPRIDLSKPAGTINNRGYVRIRINGKQHLAHRLVFLMYHGHLPKEIDHIDGNRLNNTIENLRPATRSQNQHNQGKYKNNTSGFKGVTWHRPTEKWLAQLRINGKVNHLGYYDTPKEAHEAYRKAATKYHGEFANFG